MDSTETVHDGANEKTVSTRTMEIIVSAIFMIGAVIVMWDSNRIGAGWASDGPEAGYFPFYCAVIMFIASAFTFGANIMTKVHDYSNFVDRSAFSLVLKVLVPTVVYILSIGFLGIYVASGIFIAFFMIWLGKYPLYKVVPISIGVPVFLFMMFEIWFMVPLPKGPLEAALGY